MIPTPKQIAAWALKSGAIFSAKENHFQSPSPTEVTMTIEQLQLVAALACAWQAEQDAKLCEAQAGPGLDFPDEAHDTRSVAAFDCAAVIRASVKGKE